MGNTQRKRSLKEANEKERIKEKGRLKTQLFGVEIESLLSDEQRTVGDVATYVCVVIGMKQKKQETHVGWVCAWIFQIA